MSTPNSDLKDLKDLKNTKESRETTNTTIAEVAAITTVVVTNSKPNLVRTRLQDLPTEALQLLQTKWDTSKSINESVDTTGITPLLYVLQQAHWIEKPSKNLPLFNALINCEDIDLNSAHRVEKFNSRGEFSTATPLFYAALDSNRGYMFCDREAEIFFFQALLIKGADPRIKLLLSDYKNYEEAQTILDVFLDKIGHKSLFSPIYYRRSNFASQLTSLLQYIYEATLPIVSGENANDPNANITDLQQLDQYRNQNSWPQVIFNLICGYVGRPSKIKEFTAKALDPSLSATILTWGKILYEERLRELAAVEMQLQPPTTSAISNVKTTPLLKDLPVAVLELLPPTWDLNKNINDPVDKRGMTPLIWALKPGGFIDTATNKNRHIIFDAFINCKDIDISIAHTIKQFHMIKGNSYTVTPLFYLSTQRYAPLHQFRDLLMRGANPKIKFSLPDDSFQQTILDLFLIDIPQNIYSDSGNNKDTDVLKFAHLKSFSKDYQYFVMLFQYIYENTEKIVADNDNIVTLRDLNEYRNPNLWTDPIFNILNDYAGTPDNIEDYSAKPLTPALKNFILNSGKAFYEERVAATKCTTK